MWLSVTLFVIVASLIPKECSLQSTTVTSVTTTGLESLTTSAEVNLTSSSTIAPIENTTTQFTTSFTNAILNVTTSSSGVSNYTCRTSLNTSPNLSPFWVKTVVSLVPIGTDTSNCTWRDLLESRLLTLLTTARALSSSSSSNVGRRRRAAESAQLRLQLVSAVRGSPSGNSSKVTLVFYALLGESYLPAATIVASMAGVATIAASTIGYPVDSLAVAYEALETSTSYVWLIGAMLASLGGIVLTIWAVLLAYQRCLRPLDPNKRRRLSTDTAAIDDFYADSANVPHMRANPRIGFSKADISAIADEVARQLDSQAAAAAASAAPDEAADNGASCSGDKTDGPPIRRRPLSRVDDNDADDDSVRDDGDAKRDSPADPEPEHHRREADESQGLAPEEEAQEIVQAQQQQQMQQQRLGESFAEDGTSFSMAETGGKLLHPLSSGASSALSPYRTGDQIARLRPQLEDDLKHQPKQPQPATTNAAPAGGGSRLISVRPRPGRDFVGGGGGSVSAALVRPSDQDEWDVVRDLSKRPDSDPRALAAAVRREVAQFASD